MEKIADALASVVATAAPVLAQVREQEASVQPAPDEWSPKEVVGHLIDSAANNHQRFVRAQGVAELDFPPYEQEAWVQLQDYGSAPWAELVDLWRLYNLHLAHLIRKIPADRLQTICRIGANEPVTLGFLIEDYLAHLRLHLKQLGL